MRGQRPFSVFKEAFGRGVLTKPQVWKIIMFRTIALAAAIGTLAVPAFADSVKVNLAGLDAQTAHAKIVQAAEQACNTELQGSPIDHYYGMSPCVEDSVAAAEAKIAGDHHYAAVQNGR
jgi:UrcA family protein